MPSSKTFIETSFSWKCQQQPPVSGSPGEADTPGVPRAARILNGLRLKENYVTFSGKCYRQPPASRSTGEARQLYPVDQGWLARQGLQGGARILYGPRLIFTLSYRGDSRVLGIKGGDFSKEMLTTIFCFRVHRRSQASLFSRRRLAGLPGRWDLDPVIR